MREADGCPQRLLAQANVNMEGRRRQGWTFALPSRFVMLVVARQLLVLVRALRVDFVKLLHHQYVAATCYIMLSPFWMLLSLLCSMAAHAVIQITASL